MHCVLVMTLMLRVVGNVRLLATVLCVKNGVACRVNDPVLVL